MKCDYFGLLAGIEFYTTGVWQDPSEQCDCLPTRYVEVHQSTPYGLVEHLDHVCTEHDADVRELPGFVSSEPLGGRDDGMRFDYRWTDSNGVDHFYPKLFTWHCSIHDRVCSPFKPVAGGDILRLAAKDSAVDDDMFVVLRQALEGREIGGVA